MNREKVNEWLENTFSDYTKEEAEEEVTKLTNESIMYDEFTVFYYEEQKEIKC